MVRTDDVVNEERKVMEGLDASGELRITTE